MRPHLFRGFAALTILLALAVATASAQFSVVRGIVVDPDGQPVEGAIVLFEEETGTQRAEAKTNRSGEFQQLGLRSGVYKVTASKDGVGVESVGNFEVKQQLNPTLEFRLAPAAARGPDLTTAADGSRLPDAVIKEIESAVAVAFQAMNAQQYDVAIESFSTIVTHVPACVECHFNMAVAYAQSGKVTEAEEAFLKVIELEPDSADAYRGLASIYNAQKRFDDAAKANEKALELSGSSGDAGGAADAYYSQGVIFWNGGQAGQAKEQFERAAAADPTMAMPHYYIGLANLNLGQVTEAVAAFEKYLELDPEGEKSAEVKAFVSQLRP